MGTRHLIIVKEGNQTKVAQYGQWDGQPDGQGSIVLEFLKAMNATPARKEHFRQQLKKLYFLTDKQIKKYYDDLDAYQDAKAAAEINAQHPEMSRDTGAMILQHIHNFTGEKMGLRDNIKFLGEFDCEWAYEIDLDKNVLNVYRGGRQPFKSYPLGKLPTQKKLEKDCNYSD